MNDFQEEHCLALNHNEWLVFDSVHEDNVMQKQYQLQHLVFEEGSNVLIDFHCLYMDAATSLNFHSPWTQTLELWIHYYCSPC